MNPARWIRTGEQLTISGLGALRLGTPQQRNWSRVAEATGPGGERLFVKQFVAADGRPLGELFTAEQHAASVLASVGARTFRPICPLGAASDRLVLVFPFVALERLDELARRDPAARPRLAAALGSLIAELTALAESPGEAVRRKPLSDGEPAVLQWKGLDVLNLSLGEDGVLDVYDLGPVFIGSRSAAVARLVGTALMAGWGRPLHRCVMGPPSWVAEVTRELVGLTEPAAVRRELEKHRRVRTAEPQAGSTARRAATRAATRVLAVPYWARAERWVGRTRIQGSQWPGR